MVDRTGLFVAPVPGNPPVGTSPTDGRLALGALFGTTAGRISGGGLTASATLMQVTVDAAVWRIPDPTNAGGVAVSPADAATLTFSAGPTSGSRIDLLWVRQNNYEAGDANSRVVYGVTAGAASSNPTAPAIPAGAMAIGKLTVPTGAANAAACVLVPLVPLAVLAVPALAASCVLQKNGATSGGNTGIDLGWDTVVSDLFGMRDTTNGIGLVAPWSGRYRIGARAAVTSTAIPTTASVLLDCIDSASGAVYGMVGQYGLPLDVPLLYTDDVVFTAGTRFRFRLRWSDGVARDASYGNDSVRTRIFVQYLGPA